MRLLLIADKDLRVRQRIRSIFDEDDYQVIAADTVDVVLHDILKRDVRVILLGSEFDGIPARDLIPLLKKCNRDLTIILISDEESLPLIRRFRREGIFYHALTPSSNTDNEELLQVVQCAFENCSTRRLSQKISVDNHYR